MSHKSMDLTEIGPRIKELREKQNRSQKLFAEALFITPSYLSLIENGSRTPNLEILIQVSKVCDVSLDYLIMGNMDENFDKNIRILKRLSEENSPEKVSRALRLAEYYLSLEAASSNTTDL